MLVAACNPELAAACSPELVAACNPVLKAACNPVLVAAFNPVQCDCECGRLWPTEANSVFPFVLLLFASVPD